MTGDMNTKQSDGNRYVIRQVFAGFVYSMSHMSAGAAIGFVGVFLTQEMVQSSAPLSPGERTWIVSTFPVGMMIGNLLSAALTPVLGYRRMSLLTAPVSVAGWILLVFSNQFLTLLTARAITGLAMGAFDGAARAYICEITCIRLRGPVGMLTNLLMAVNMLIVYAASSKVSWRIAVAVTALPPYLVQFIGSLYLPEAAIWLLTDKSRHEPARKSIEFFRGVGEQANLELKAAQVSVAADDQQFHQSSIRLKLTTMFGNSGSRRAFLLLAVQLVFGVFNVGEAVSNFGTVIFAQAAESTNPYYSSIYVGLVRIAGYLMSASLIEKVGRKALLQGSAAIQLIGGAIVACFFHLSSLGTRLSPFILLTGVMLVYFAYGVGIMPVTWVLFSELMPNKSRAVGLNILLVLFGVLMFSFMHVFTECERLAGTHVVFWLLSGMSLLQILFSVWWLPETRGLTLDDIENRFFSAKSKSQEDGVESGRCNHALEL